MRRFTFFLAAAALVACAVFWVAQVEAQQSPTRSFSEQVAKISTDTLTWYNAGTAIKVDTSIGTVSDTTYATFTGGASAVVLQTLVREVGADSLNKTFIFQVGTSPEKTAMWHSLLGTVASVTHAASDTNFIVLHTDTWTAAPVDTSAALANATEAAAAMQTVEAGDRAMVHAMPFLRVITTSAAAAADSNLMTILVTRRYPR